MQTVKPTGKDLETFKAAASLLKQANAEIAAAKKAIEASKKKIAEWLKANRDIDLDALEMGEFVLIEGALMIEIGKMRNFDQSAFLLAEPEAYARFERDMPVKRFKPLV